MEVKEAISDVEEEIKVATSKFMRFASPHEGLAVIWEEFEELKEEVFKPFSVRRVILMRKEAKHLAAMATRFMVDLT